MSGTGPVVSVLIPVFNGARFLLEALDSARGQTYRPIEVVVIDDGSADDSARIAESQPGVVCLRGPHQGEAAARNAGLAQARGELVAFLDADDRWHPEKLGRQVAALAAEPGRPGVLCRFRNFLDAGAARPEWLRPETFLEERAGSMPSLCTLLGRRTTFATVGPFRPELEGSSDLDWFVRAADAGLAFPMLPEVLVERRLHDANMSYGSRGSSQRLLRIFRDSIARKRAASAGDPASPDAEPQEGGGPRR